MTSDLQLSQPPAGGGPGEDEDELARGEGQLLRPARRVGGGHLGDVWVRGDRRV